MLTTLNIFFEIKSSTLVSNLYGLMRHILCLIFFGAYFNINLPFVKHCVITNEPLYGVSYLYAVWLVIMTLSPTLQS